MIDRRKKQVHEVLLSQSLVTSSYESEAAKIFMKFLREHPKLNEEDVEMDINSWEEEEDYYGHGGGYFHEVEIYTTREETDDEFNKRIDSEEKEAYKGFKGQLIKLARNIRYDFDCICGDEHCEALYKFGCEILKSELGIQK